MMRSFKALGMALLAVFAMSAIAASAASANQFHSSVEKTTLTVASNEDQKFLYESGGKTVKCTGVGGSGEANTATTSTVTFNPTYSGCTVDGIAFSTAQVSFNECDYLFHVDASANEGATDVVCTGSSQITITVKVFGVSVCTFHIGKQTPSGKSKYANSGAKQVKVQPNQTGITGSKQGGSECGSASSTSGTYTGSVVVKGEKAGTQEEVAVQVG
jgi:hypothetical protein